MKAHTGRKMKKLGVAGDRAFRTVLSSALAIISSSGSEREAKK